MFKKLFRSLFASEKKAGIPGQLRALLVEAGKASWTNNNYQCLAREGYEKNVIAFKCISSIANAVADIPIIIKINGTEIEDPEHSKNRTARAIMRPNPKQSYESFMQAAISHRLISGNTYFHLLDGKVSRELVGLELFRPDRVTIETDGKGLPIAFMYSMNGTIYTYPIDQLTSLSEVLQVKTFHPLDDLYGLSPISAAAMSIDQHNESSEWNKSLLENSSRPAALLTLNDRGDNAPVLGLEQMRDINNLIEERLSGAQNAGRTVAINYDMKYQTISLSPIDMDWLNGRAASARDICLAFNYPSILLGYPEASTYNNVSEAKLALYEETVIPLANTVLGELTNWLSLQLGQEIEIDLDLDKVSALQSRRQTARENARNDMTAGLITVNEAREEINYEPVKGGDEILVPAGKLPINFDVTQMDQPKYQAWLESEGFTKELAEQYATLAFTKV